MTKHWLETSRLETSRILWPKRIRNEEFWRQEGQRPIEEEIKKRTWRWIGKTLRGRDKQVAKTTL